jgi:large subunit ribosomal protein L22
MAVAVARAKQLRISARKLRLVADAIRGKKVAVARDILRFTPKAGAPLLATVLNAAVANAESKATERRERIDTDEMVITKLLVDVGAQTLRRFQSSPRGRAVPIRKRNSRIELVIAHK